MGNKYTKFKLIDLLGMLAYLLMAGSCFLPFLNYTTLTSVETITYFQGNGKLILGFSLLAILFIILRFFKYTFMCLGLTIGVLVYDVTFGLLEVVKEKITVYQLRYGFYLIALGMVVNLIYIIIKMLIITKEYNKQYEENNYIMENNSKNNSDLIEILDIGEDNNPQMQLLNEYKVEEENDGIPSIDAEELLVMESEIQKEELDDDSKPMSIFSDIPDIDLVNNELGNNKIEDDTKISIYTNEPPPLYKLCDKCGMQINYSDDICPVCGKQF